MNSYLELLDNFHIVHALSGHAPVALAVFGLLVMLLGVATKLKSAALRGTALAVFAILAGAAYGASITGMAAKDALPKDAMISMSKIFELHQQVAQYAWIPAAVTALFILLCYSEGTRGTFTALALLASLVTLAGIGTVAVTGTQLVYQHGAGVAQNSPPAQAAPEEKASSPEPAPDPAKGALFKLQMPVGAPPTGSAPPPPTAPPAAPPTSEAAPPNAVPALPPAETVTDNL